MVNPGDVLDLTLRNLRVVEVKHMSTLYMGVLPNGEPFEVRVPFDADVRTAPAERESGCPNCPPGYDCSRGVYLTVQPADEEDTGCPAWTMGGGLSERNHDAHECTDADAAHGNLHVCACGYEWGDV